MRILWMTGLLLVACLAQAADGRGGRVVAEHTATQTEAWLHLQREGHAASLAPQGLTPAERERAIQRWLDSYQHAIPDFFEQDSGGEIDR